MTALRNATTPKLNLTPRRRDEVIVPRPCPGEHKALVRAAAAETVFSHGDTLNDLVKV